MKKPSLPSLSGAHLMEHDIELRRAVFANGESCVRATVACGRRGTDIDVEICARCAHFARIETHEAGYILLCDDCEHKPDLDEAVEGGAAAASESLPPAEGSREEEVVIYTQLIGRVMRTTSFVRLDDAQSALGSTLETLGFLLSPRLASTLESALPVACASALALGVTRRQSEGTPSSEQTPSWLTSDVRTQGMQEICGVLGSLLPPDLVQRLARELPAELATNLDGRNGS